MSLRPIETAPRTVRSRSPNSSRATSEAEYTDAPLSSTRTIGMGRGKGMSRKTCSVSRPAVPLPTAMISLPNRSAMSRAARAASAAWRSEPCGKSVSWWRSFPCSSRQTALHPVRNPGSTASTRLRPSGGAKSSSRRLAANTRMASWSARSLSATRISVSSDRPSRRR